MKRELGHFYIGESYGGDQEWFADAWMKVGGCGAVTACDLCIFLAKYHGMKELYPFDANNVTMEEYLDFGMQMKPFLSPRASGIDRTDIYIDGFYAYLSSLGTWPVHLQGISGEEDVETAVSLIKDQIERGYPVPYLMLLHRDKKLDDYMWHWFLLNGYEEKGETFLVKVVSYGKPVWMNLRHLWRTDRKRKGGVVLINPSNHKTE
ncbi:MAG: hypothetical protein IJ744_12245 [Lachnospiraceae bacterium]|nr:hypothetical protein [Lachnospiraceae bacterium]